MDQSGPALAALTQYGQGLAGTYYNDAFNRAQSSFNTNQNTTLNNLTALTNTGLAANNQNNTLLSTLGAPQAANTINAANTNATLQQYNAGLQTSGQQNLGTLNTNAQLGAGQLGVNAAKTAGDFSVNGANATAAGITGQGTAITQGAEDLGSLAKYFVQ